MFTGSCFNYFPLSLIPWIMEIHDGGGRSIHFPRSLTSFMMLMQVIIRTEVSSAIAIKGSEFYYRGTAYSRPWKLEKHSSSLAFSSDISTSAVR
jgi:hypothetical protein